ncbi:o-succinylbenzoate synthase [Nitriliruptoraceae bacterium ZYF776]|nr:o-succinylbenzoate synthase [Profundirhabdus halotolerans]
MPLVRPFRTSFGVQTARDVLLVHLVDDAGHEGWGECVTTAAPLYSDEFTDGAALVLRDHLLPTVLDGTPLDAVALPHRLRRFHGHRMAKAALELAAWDLQLRQAGVSLADHLGVAVDRVSAGVSVGIPEGGTAALVEQVHGHLDEGYRRIKCKVEPGFDVAPLAAVRAAIGDEVPLQVDANAAYDPDDPAHVRALDGLDELGLQLLEQPFAPRRLDAHAHHARRWRTPVCLDESVEDVRDAVTAVETGAAAIVNIKVGRVGGLVEAVGVHDACRSRGVPVWCGGMLETGIGRTSNVALAGLPGFTLPGDTSASARYFAHDLTAPFVLDDGQLAVDRTPGAARAPDPQRLAAWTTSRTPVPA